MSPYTNPSRGRKILIAAMPIMALTATLANAAFISGVSTTSSVGTFSTYNIVNLTNLSGLSIPDPTGIHSDNFNHHWMAQEGSTSGTLVFDLGTFHSIQSLTIWSYRYSIPRSVKDFNLAYSVDGISFTPDGAGTRTLAQTDVGQTFGSSDVVARYVRMNIINNYGDSNYMGLGEVQFTGTPTTVPEPASLTLIALGGVAATLTRSRRRTV